MQRPLSFFVAALCASFALCTSGCLSRKPRVNSRASTPTKIEQAVLVYLDGVGLPNEIYAKYDLQGLDERIDAVLRAKHVGEFDGDETRNTETVLYFYGPDADALFAAIEPELRAYPLCRGARVIIRKGPPGAPSRELRLPSSG